VRGLKRKRLETATRTAHGVDDRRSAGASEGSVARGDFAREQYDAHKRVLQAELATLEPPLAAETRSLILRLARENPR
jgi:hypothetical protein